MKKFVSSLLLPLIMIGCGGGSSSENIGTGYYVDSAVEGVNYSCGSQSGVTDSEGMFKFESGKECSFSINSKVFKTVVASKLTHGVTIQEDDPVKARFLQTLDNDGNPDNGIKILATSKSVVSKIPTSDTDFAILNASLAGVTDYQGKPISEGDAITHLDKSIAKATASATSVREGETITLSASDISQGTISTYEWTENSVRISTEKSFTKSNFSLGTHTLTLVVKKADGAETTSSVTFEVISAATATIWDNVNPLATNGNNKLFVTSDENNKFYLKLESPNDMSTVEFFIDSDNSAISGLKTDAWPEAGFDYRVVDSGLYKLQNSEDFSGKLVQQFTYRIVANTLIIELDKSNFDYLAQKVGISVFFGLGNENNGQLARFTDVNFNANQDDIVAPIITVITVTGDNPLILGVNDNYTDLGATATDIRDGSVSVTVDSAGVDTSKAGFYSVIYTATDSAGNIGKADRVVEVQGGAVPSTLEVKNMGAFTDSVVVNHQTGQVWSNDDRNETTTRGCYIFGEEVPYTDLAGIFKNFCDESAYAGFHDWRVPTSLEMSKFTVRMKQEGKTPGMARTGCTRTLSIDNNTTVKAVWTHNMKQPGQLDTGTLTPSGGRCVRGPVDSDAGGFSSEEIGLDKAKVMVDTNNNLMWVNETSFGACMAIHAGKQEEYNISKGFCSTLDFAGHANWRDPSSAELQDFIVRTNEAHILPGYAAPCKALLARDANGNETSISTRYDATKTWGTMSPLVVPLTSNIGLRCVRDN